MNNEIARGNYHGEEIVFFASVYQHDKSLAIICETKHGEPYATITVNLDGQQPGLTDSSIYVNHDVFDNKELFEFVVETLLKSETLAPVRFGYAESVKADLLSEIAQKCGKVCEEMRETL